MLPINQHFTKQQHWPQQACNVLQRAALTTGSLLVEQLCGGVVEAIRWSKALALGAAGVDCSADLGSKHLAQLHTPLVKAVDAPDESLQRIHRSIQ